MEEDDFELEEGVFPILSGAPLYTGMNRRELVLSNHHINTNHCRIGLALLS